MVELLLRFLSFFVLFLKTFEHNHTQTHHLALSLTLEIHLGEMGKVENNKP